MQDKSSSFFLNINPNRTNNYDYRFKYIVAGSSGVGKTNVLHMYFNNTFNS